MINSAFISPLLNPPHLNIVLLESYLLFIFIGCTMWNIKVNK